MGEDIFVIRLLGTKIVVDIFEKLVIMWHMIENAQEPLISELQTEYDAFFGDGEWLRMTQIFEKVVDI